ncbi:SusD/RagB family nutrient-binding outer membrane lipoprotein [Mucilaginibacter robiniae]|uniref:SusD/RagB family nutrient-binding outer membrane lipoprotein n=1 Tax=Mucilaginibacter robiniae TaxID=2728022 RepID=A0A7L5E023_9SPHI|nr:SusD/RagB family nutrient-binding outer membrane lipoprotein [Mucilaginibacter robiniae]QJD96585.1 SusD/RagB family nutrient-binding outer membrane lipoprotein [Mucilaginibacter robiniae]
MLAIAESSCKKNFLELSTNPNQPSVATPQLILTGALKTSAGIINGTGYTQYGNWMGYLSWSTSYQPNVALEQYTFTTADYNVFTPLYANISNYSALTSSTTEPYFQAIAKIMTVYDYQQLVDNYNNVPYFNAIQATSNLTPTYDSGSAIYDDLLKQLDASISLIQKASSSALNPGTSDVMFQGNMTKWLKFANTLKLRLAIRQSNISSKTSALKTAIAATSSIGYIDATFHAAVNPGYLSVDANGGQQSPFWISYGYTQSGTGQTNNLQYQANSYAVSFYSNDNDPRLTLAYQANASGNIVATPFGATSTTPAGQTGSKFGPGLLKSPTMDAIIMNSSEALFLQAEAVNAGYISGDAATLYKAGITASFTEFGVTNASAAAATYYAQSAIAYPTTGAAAQEKAIIVQKWAALNGYGFLEAYNEYRRTGYPDNIPLSVYPGANAPNQVTRILYPAIEYQTNAANVAAQGNIDRFTSKIFWAK